MDLNLDKLENQATTLLRDACSSHGIWASPDDQENYRRIWSRDSIIAGIAGLLANDEKVINGLGNSILTLAKYQHPRGMIPSNVLPDEDAPEVSYGTLVGRVDANTWFIIGTCLYLIRNPNGALIDKLRPKMQLALNLLDQWEFNAGGLLYTPLSGNWADEYPIEGHTLYDNLLRLWALKLYNHLFNDEERERQEQMIEQKIAINFWPITDRADHPAVYHKRAYTEIANSEPKHFACSIDPRGYNMHFDAAGNGLALLLRLASKTQFKKTMNYLKEIFRQVSTVLIPAFWPAISSDDPEWEDLKNNFNYNFKNYPHNYHNGGIWPVWMGFFALGASVTSNSDLPETLLRAWMKIEDPDNIKFSEYIASNTLKHGGKNRLCYSASGLIFLISAIRKDSLKKLHLI
jgi:hypothetical protein